MLMIRGKLILAEVDSIILELRTQLASKGIYRFNRIKKSRNNIQTNCPFHSDGMEKNPSFGIALNDNKGIKAGHCHCFTCGYSNYFDDFVSHCFGFNDRGRMGSEWLLKNFTVGVADERKIIKRIERNPVEENKPVYITDDELDKYRYSHEYHYERGLTDELLNAFDIGFDPKTNSITFPVWDINGNCVFVGKRGITNKIFDYPEGVEKPLYLANFIIGKYDYVIVTEGVFDAIAFHKIGKPAIALLGVGSKEQVEMLKRLSVKKIILCMDGDNAGIAATNRLRTLLKGSRKLIKEYNVPRGKDPDDLTSDELMNLKEY